MSNHTSVAFGSIENLIGTITEGCSTSPADECPICKETYTFNSDQPIKTKCGHIFHSRCLQTWFESQTERTTCPTCRTEYSWTPEAAESEPPGWEGLTAAYNELTRIHMYQCLYDEMSKLWNHSRSWEFVEKTFLDLCAHQPSTAAGYVMVTAIVKVLGHFAEDQQQDKKKFEGITSILDEHEARAHENGCTIEQAYAAAGLASGVQT